MLYLKRVNVFFEGARCIDNFICIAKLLEIYGTSGDVVANHFVVIIVVQIITDFDMTLTRYYINGDRGCTSYGKCILEHYK